MTKPSGTGMKPRQCEVCETTFTARTITTKYCTPICATRGYNARRKADGRLAQQVKDSAAHRATYMATWRGQRRGLVPCSACGVTVERGHNARYRRTACSTRCRAYLRNGTWPSTPVPDRHPTRSTPVPDGHPSRCSSPRIRFMVGSCIRCGTGYITDRMAGRNLTDRYCSAQCGKAQGKARRRARKKEAYVSDVRPIAIYERDDWTCQLCAIRIDRDAVVPHPLAPTIDHVIPLARGGTHEPANVQAAHFLCNSRKSDRTLNDQLALTA